MSRFHSFRFFGCALALAALLQAGCASAPPTRPASLALRDYSYAKTYARWLLEKEMRRNKVTGLSVALVDDQEIVWSEGFGFASEAKKIPVDAETVFQAGSISKLFTATALMQLVEQGKVDLDRPLQEYLPEFSIKSRFTDAKPVTLRLLLTHHSGVRSDRLADGSYPNEPPAGYENDFLSVPGQLKDDYLAAPPGEVFAYSNLGFELIGAAVVRVSGEDFPSRLSNSVFAPMGMQHSSFLRTDAIRKKLSRGYWGGREVEPSYVRGLPAGALNTTAEDLAEFIKMVLAEGRTGDAQILRQETLREMLEPQRVGTELDGEQKFGLGWGIAPLKSSLSFKKLVAHGGSLPPFNSMLMVLPEEKLGIAILTNSDGGGQVAGSAAIEILRRAWEAKTGGTFVEASVPEQTELPVEKLDALAGVYASGGYGLTTIVRSGSSLKLQMADGPKLNLVPCIDGSFAVDYRILGIKVSGKGMINHHVYFREARGRTLFDYYVGDGLTRVGERVEGAPLAESWRRRLGRYEVINRGAAPGLTVVSLVYDNNTRLLLAAIPGAEPIALGTVSDSEAIILGLGRGAGETLQFSNANGEERLKYSGYEFRRGP